MQRLISFRVPNSGRNEILKQVRICTRKKDTKKQKGIDILSIFSRACNESGEWENGEVTKATAMVYLVKH